MFTNKITFDKTNTLKKAIIAAVAASTIGLAAVGTGTVNAATTSQPAVSTESVSSTKAPATTSSTDTSSETPASTTTTSTKPTLSGILSEIGSAAQGFFGFVGNVMQTVTALLTFLNKL